METTSTMKRAMRRAALRKKKQQVERDYWEHRDWLPGLEPRSRARHVGRWARTPAERTSHWRGSNPRRYQSGRDGLTRQELQHLLRARFELQEIFGSFMNPTPGWSAVAHEILAAS